MTNETNTINLPAIITATGSGETVEIKTGDWEDSQGFAEYLFTYACGVILQRASAGKNDDAEKAATAVKAAIERLQNGVVPAGGGFAKLSPEDYAMKETLQANKVKFEKGETVAICLMRIAMKLTEIPEGEEEAPEEDIVATRDALQAELEGSEVYKSALKARKAKAKTTASSGLISKL